MPRVPLAVREFARRWKRDRLWDTAAALAFFTVLAIAPFVLLITSLATFLVSAREAGALVEGGMAGLAPAAATHLMGQRIASLGGTGHGALLASGGTIGLLAGANAMAAATRALNTVYQVAERRSFWRRQGAALLWTAVSGALLLLAIALVVMGGGRGGRFGHLAWLRFPASGATMMFCWALLYRVLPDVQQRFRFVTVGSVLGVLAWLGTSWALSWYQAAHESQLGLSYGPLLGLISTIACIWLMSLAFVMGAELNALLEHLGPSGKNPGGRRV